MLTKTVRLIIAILLITTSVAPTSVFASRSQMPLGDVASIFKTRASHEIWLPTHIVAGDFERAYVLMLPTRLAQASAGYTERMSSPPVSAANSNALIPDNFDHFSIQLPASGTAGIGFSAVITAEDILNSVIITFTDQITLTTSNGGVISPQYITPTAGVWSGSISLTTAGSARVVQAASGAFSDQDTLDIDPGPADTLFVSPSSTAVTAGTPVAYTAVATDTFGNALGDVTVSTTFSIDPASGAVISGSNITPTLVGTWSVTGTNGSAVDNTASLTVNAGAVFTLSVSPSSTTVTAGTPVAYTAVASDTYGNPIGNVTGSTTFSITFASGGSFSASSVIPIFIGTWTVTGTNGSAVDTASLTVNPAAPAELTIAPATSIISAGVPITYSAIATDTFGNALGDVTASTTFDIVAGSDGVFAGAVVTPTIAGTWAVTGTIDSVVDSASLDVTHGPASTLVISPMSSNIVAGTLIAYTAVATDTFGNTLGNVTSLTAFSIPAASGGVFAGSNVTPTLVGVWTVTGTIDSAIDLALVTITPDVPFTLTIAPASAVISAGVSLAYSAVATDTYGNLIGDVTAATTFSIPLASGATFAGSSSITPTVAAGWTVSAINGIAQDNASLTVEPNVPFTLTLSPATVVISAGTPIAYSAVATDTYGNLIGNVTGVTTFSIDPASGDSFTGNSLSPTVAAVWTVTGTINGAQDTATLTVTPGDYTRLALETAADGLGTELGPFTMTLYDTLTLYAVRYDDWDNMIATSSASWSGTGIVASGDLTPATGISTTFTPAVIISGTGTINATSGSESDSSGTITVLAPSLIISKEDLADPVAAATTLGYAVRVTNVGTAAAQYVTVTETYDPNVTFIAAVPPADAGTGGTVWTIPTLAADSLPMLIQIFTLVNGSLPISTVLTNTVQVSAGRIATSVVTETTKVTVTPNLQISKVQLSPLGNSVRVGDTIIYQINYTNTGTAVLNNVVVTETYDDAIEFVTAIPAPTTITNTRRWEIGTLAGSGGSGSIALTVQVRTPLPDGTPLINIVGASSVLTTALNYQLAPITINAPELSLSKHASSSAVQANTRLTYTLAYTNSGGTYASGVVITDQLPSDVTFIGATPLQSTFSGNLITWNLGEVITQSSGLIIVSVQVNNNIDNGTVITNVSRISALELVSATAQITTTINSAPDLALSISDGNTSVVAGQRLTYTLSYTNNGNAPADGVELTSRIPDNTNFQGCNPACTPLGGGVYAFTLPFVNAATGNSATLVVEVDSPLPAGVRWITSTGQITTTTPGDVLIDNTAQDVDTIATVPQLALSVDYDSSTPYPTKRITYTVRYTNTSAMDTTGVVLTLTRSSHVTYVGNGWIFLGGGDYEIIVGNLSAGVSGVETFVVDLPNPFTNAMASFLNDFAIHDDGPRDLPIASAFVPTMVGIPDLRIESVSVPYMTVGTPFSATVTIRNIGTGIACNPQFCGGYFLDAFIDPTDPPISSGFNGLGPVYRDVGRLAPGEAVMVQFEAAPNPKGNLKFTNGQTFVLYFKIDNEDCAGALSCIPVTADHGLVPESNEYNNVMMVSVAEPPRDLNVYLPIISKNFAATP